MTSGSTANPSRYARMRITTMTPTRRPLALTPRSAFARHFVDSPQVAKQHRHQCERVGIWPVTQGLVGVFVHFHENRVDPDCGRRPRERGDEFALTARSLTTRP